ncbi:hypothetical protein TSUD_241000 [Trifolium subterraneum]|uniref:Uncharacterized protein n=1 Tax=Trifolium subterraneum TaxID=3900 RepID=A0A2Z6PIQ5_TRISU|nr:hypothetical protein TSUD_241000 [Trifolium subterraneum]
MLYLKEKQNKLGEMLSEITDGLKLVRRCKRSIGEKWAEAKDVNKGVKRKKRTLVKAASKVSKKDGGSSSQVVSADASLGNDVVLDKSSPQRVLRPRQKGVASDSSLNDAGGSVPDAHTAPTVVSGGIVSPEDVAKLQKEIDDLQSSRDEAVKLGKKKEDAMVQLKVTHAGEFDRLKKTYDFDQALWRRRISADELMTVI